MHACAGRQAGRQAGGQAGRRAGRQAGRQAAERLHTKIYFLPWRMQPSGMWRHVPLLITEVSVEHIAFIIRVTRTGALRLLVTVNVVLSSPILDILMMEAICFTETSIVTRTTLRNIPGDVILHSHRREYCGSYIYFVGEVGRLLNEALNLLLSRLFNRSSCGNLGPISM
jgi:hypothetical protein